MSKSIAIVGSGMGGLSAGIFGRLNDFETDIFEMHTIPGGQCTAWKRKGYTFDGCIHHLFGCGPASAIYGLWEQLGAVPRDFAPLRECVSVLSPEGTLFRDYYDPELLESHMNAIAPNDRTAIRDYVNGISTTAKSDAMGKMMMSSRLGMVAALPGLLRSSRWLRPTMAQYAQRFREPVLRDSMPLLVYANPGVPLIVHLVRHAYGLSGALQWPIGGAQEFAQSIARRYTDLGGRIHYRSRVTKILTEGNRAVGVRLEDGSEHKADFVISNADGRKTITGMLDGRFANERIHSLCAPPPDEMQFAVQVYLGVDRDLSSEPSSMILRLPEPVVLADHSCHEVELQTYGFDPTMAPEGKGVIKVELYSRYSFWKNLAALGREAYVEEKQRLASQVVNLLERHYFSGLQSQVEVVDVSTLLTWERYTGGSMGLGIYPNRELSVLGSVLGKSQQDALPGLRGFRFAGTWATGGGALFTNALSGKRVIQAFSKDAGQPFVE